MPTLLFAQQKVKINSYLDSLQTALKRAVQDTAKANTLFQMSDYWSSLDSTKAVHYVQEAMQVRLDKYHRGVAYFYLGGAYFDFDFDKAIAAYYQAGELLSTFNTASAYEFRSRAWGNIGALEQRKNNNQKYIDILLTKAIPLAAKAGDSLRMARQYMDVGLPFMNFKSYKKAILYFKKSVDIFQRHHIKSLTLADGYNNLSKAYSLAGEMPLAKPMLDSAWNILKQETPSTYHAYYYAQEGLYFTRIGEWAKAAASLNKGISLAEELKNKRDVSLLLYGFVDLYTSQKKLVPLKKVLLRLNQDTVFLTAQDRQQLLLDLAQVDRILGNSKNAYNWLWQYTQLTDSLNKAQINYQIFALETKFNFTEKQKEILKLQQKAEQQKIVFGSSVLLLVVSLILFAYLMKQRKLKVEQQLKTLEQEQQIKVAESLLLGEEKERGRLARDLHDGLGGLLAGVKVNLSDGDNQSHTSIKKTSDQLDNAISELRRIARNLMPETLLRSGLETALKDLCQSLSTLKMCVELQTINISKGIDLQIQLVIYRILQELLNNVIKHADASEVFVQCSQQDQVFYITVEDDGKGFDTTAMKNTGNGIGLKNISSRVEFLHGKLEIRSIIQKGTEINIELLCSK